MRLIDFKRVLKYFDIEKGSLSAVDMTGNVIRYELRYGGHKYSFVDDGKSNDVLLSRDIGDFEYLNNNNSSDINPNKGVIAHLSTRKDLLLSLLAASRYNSKNYVGSYEEISASIIGEILAEVNPFISYNKVLEMSGENINFINQTLKDGLRNFANAVNPFHDLSPDVIDASIYPPSIEIGGGEYKVKDENSEKKHTAGTWLEIVDLRTNNSTKYTYGAGGFSYRLNCITPDKSERFELIYNYSTKSKSEKIIIRKWLGRKTEKTVVRRGKKQDISDYFGTETKWSYSLNDEFLYDLKSNAVDISTINKLSGKFEKTSYPVILPKDLEKLYICINDAIRYASEITNFISKKDGRRR